MGWQARSSSSQSMFQNQNHQHQVSTCSSRPTESQTLQMESTNWGFKSCKLVLKHSKVWQPLPWVSDLDLFRACLGKKILFYFLSTHSISLTSDRLVCDRLLFFFFFFLPHQTMLPHQLGVLHLNLVLTLPRDTVRSNRLKSWGTEPRPDESQVQVVDLCFWSTSSKLGVQITHSWDLINLLEQLPKLRKTVYLLDYQYIMLLLLSCFSCVRLCATP